MVRHKWHIRICLHHLRQSHHHHHHTINQPHNHAQCTQPMPRRRYSTPLPNPTTMPSALSLCHTDDTLHFASLYWSAVSFCPSSSTNTTAADPKATALPPSTPAPSRSSAAATAPLSISQQASPSTSTHQPPPPPPQLPQPLPPPTLPPPVTATQPPSPCPLQAQQSQSRPAVRNGHTRPLPTSQTINVTVRHLHLRTHATPNPLNNHANPEVFGRHRPCGNAHVHRHGNT